MFAPLDKFSLLLMGFPRGIILSVKFVPRDDRAVSDRRARRRPRVLLQRRGGIGPMIEFLSGYTSLAGAIGVFSAIACGLMILMLTMPPQKRGRSLVERYERVTRPIV